MTTDKLFIVETLRNDINSHGLISGEIIIQFDDINPNSRNIKLIVDNFFEHNSIKTFPIDYNITEIAEKEALSSIIYGLSEKPNYTKINKPFIKTDQNKFAYTFIQLFDNPKYYSINTRLYKTDLDLEDFWESGGAIVIDKCSIGLFWTNDLYDKF